MKIQYKAASTMALFGVIIVALLSAGYDMLNREFAIDKEIKNIQNISEEVALNIDSHLREKAAISMTLSSAPLIKDALLKSNSEFTLLAAEERKREIENLNQQWMNTTDVNDPFIQTHMSNPIAEYFKQQQIIIPGEYGEIFLTNRYGVMIATTGKLTTLAHRSKYWWQASYDDGKGKTFLDDRGFDASVKGYVLGVVIPVRDGNEIIGILKCNVNIMGQLTNVGQEFELRRPGKIKIVRTGGLVVSGPDLTPLATRVHEDLIELLEKKQSDSTIVAENSVDQLVATAPIEITMGSEQFTFGGKLESIDQIKGNQGEAWHVVITYSEEAAIQTAHEGTILIVYIGLVFTLLSAVVALVIGRLAAKPIVELATVAHSIGDGGLDSRTLVRSNDEIGSLAQSLNRMAENLQKTMASRDELSREVEQRKKAEEKLQLLSATDELTGADNRRAFNDKLHANIGRAKRYDEPLSLLLFDIDHFKKVNDSYGHDVGDLVLKTLVQATKGSIRQEDILARWGGEEFTLLLPQTGKVAAMQQAERLRKAISAYDFPTVGQITISIGHTELQPSDAPDSFVKRADTALYQAKEGGRNMVKSCSA